ncbi:type III-A CRISPR-associated RAMP protein Csm3 [Weissella soli]|uniref:type III-A CRISPR-associated RAMP protein Csm3 n=1 Tax=Weissella soli TaxID=155866 RepID=UPI001F46C4EF|nr:type III-A CRISPR-associated RAMP protein Csm3 [Weissella soli]GJM48398.1 type III-A CRISPR-associated RAMP protein Csm3 [Weissella soli]
MAYSKVKITGLIELETGLHIGGSSAFAAIGATDSPVIKDPLTNLPIIPGSTLKGKVRSLLARAFNERTAEKPHQDTESIRRLFGDSESDEYKIGRLIFRDAHLTNADELTNKGARTLTEVKFENTIDRITAMANPRQIERAIRGSQFKFELIYDVQEETDVPEDIDLIVSGLQLLELDYLGGSGSRGYGKVDFKNFIVETAFGEFDSTELQKKLDELTPAEV